MRAHVAENERVGSKTWVSGTWDPVAASKAVHAKGETAVYWRKSLAFV